MNEVVRAQIVEALCELRSVKAKNSELMDAWLAIPSRDFRILLQNHMDIEEQIINWLKELSEPETRSYLPPAPDGGNPHLFRELFARVDDEYIEQLHAEQAAILNDSADEANDDSAYEAEILDDSEIY